MINNSYPKFLFFLACLIAAATAVAQDAYTVRVGVFRDVRGADFQPIEDLGFVHSLPAGGKEVEVFIGQFSQQDQATDIAGQLSQRGFLNARVVNLPAGAGQALNMIQFSLHAAGRPIPWETYEKLGELHAESTDGTLKIFTGPYATMDEANAALPAIRQAGYKDAFIKRVGSLRLIPIDAFESGVKKPLIPITLPVKTEGPGATILPASTPAPEKNTASVTPSATKPAPAPASYGTVISTPPPTAKPEMEEDSNATAASPTPPSATAAVVQRASLPTLSASQKRHSTAELQTVLKAKGYYTGSIDGLYGPGTKAAYEKAWNALPEMRKYRLLSDAGFAPTDASRNAVSQWPEVAVLMTIAEDLAAGNADVNRARKMAGQRSELLTTKENLNPEATDRTKEWAESLWEGLDEWAAEDPLHDQIITAFRVSYYQTQSRLEQHYSDGGFGPIEARDLAIAMMQNLTGAQLSRFL